MDARVRALRRFGLPQRVIAAILGVTSEQVASGEPIPAPAGGGGAPQLPDLSAEINPDWNSVGLGPDVDGMVPGPTTFWVREHAGYNNTTGELDPDTAYLVVATYVVASDTDWGGLDIRRPGSGFGGFNQARLASFDGTATPDSPAIRSAVLPAGADVDLGVALGTAGCRLINIQLYPLAASSGGAGGSSAGALVPDYANVYNLTNEDVTALASGDGRVPAVDRPCMVVVNLDLDPGVGTGTANVGVLTPDLNYVEFGSPRVDGKTTVTIPYLGPNDTWYAVVDSIGGASAVIGATEVPLVAA